MAVDGISTKTATQTDSFQLQETSAIQELIQDLLTKHLGNKPGVSDYKTYIEQISLMLDQAFDEKQPISRLLKARALATDELLTIIWQQAITEEGHGCSLIAVGGYGRSELHPYSDIDLLILTPKTSKISRSLKDGLERFVASLWDLGLDIGHSVRDIKSCYTMAKSDVTVMTNLMESRLIIGDEVAFDELQEKLNSKRLWPSKDFFTAKFQEQRNRHEKFKKTSYALEPNIKKSPGSLRDIQLISWVTKHHYNVDSLSELVDSDFVTGHEYQTLRQSELFLWRLRFALHQIAGRAEDRLLFDFQKPVAEKMGYEDSKHQVDVEHLMQDYYKVVRTVRELNDMLLQHFSETILKRDKDRTIKAIDDNFQRCGVRIEARADDLFIRDPNKLLELFLHMADDPEIIGIRAPTLRQIFIARQEIDSQAFYNDAEARRLFIEIIKHPNGMERAFTYMKRYGVLRTYLPSYARIVGQMQYDLFHIYTVDEHTLFVMNNIASFSRPESRAEFPLCHQVMMEVPQRELLLLGALFHDIGKGQGGDHSEIGAIEAHKFCQAHGLCKHDTEVIVWLVADHLVMSMTAQRKDITDPDVIHQFASRVGTVENLNYIYLLTVADICATSHTLWNNWKDTLLSDLYKLTRNALERGLENKIKTKDLINDVKSSVIESLKGRGFNAETVLTLWQNFKDDYFVRNPVKRIAWQTRILLSKGAEASLVDIYRDPQNLATELFVYMPQHKGYFTHITTMIYRKNLSIQDASLHTTEDDYMMGSFVLLESDGSAVEDASRGKGLKELLTQQLNGESVEDSNGIQKAPHRYQHFDVPTEVNFSVAENGLRTLVEISTLDRPGLLAEIGMAFQTCDVALQSAKVVTLGEKVEDVFYVTNPDQSLLTGQQELTLKMALLDRLDSNE